MSTVSDNKPNRTPLFIAAGGIAVAIVLDVALSGGSGASDAMSFFGRFHPLAVHMPIGMILLLAALEGLCVWPKLRARIDPAVSTVLRLALLSALAAFTMGLLLAHGGGYPAKLLRLHKLLTLATVIGAAGSVFAWSVVETGANRLFYRGALMATVTLLSIGAHLGGSMTHGDNYLVQYEGTRGQHGHCVPRRRAATSRTRVGSARVRGCRDAGAEGEVHRVPRAREIEGGTAHG